MSGRRVDGAGRGVGSGGRGGGRGSGRGSAGGARSENPFDVLGGGDVREELRFGSGRSVEEVIRNLEGDLEEEEEMEFVEDEVEELVKEVGESMEIGREKGGEDKGAKPVWVDRMQKGVGAAAKPRAYSEVLAGNRESTNGMSLRFIPPENPGSVKFTVEEVENERKYWENTLIGAVAGPKVSFSMMERFVGLRWNNIAKPEIYLNENGMFVFRFQSGEDMNTVLGGGPWLFKGAFPLMLRRWEPGLKIDTTSLDDVPMWIKLPDLDYQFWSAEGLK